MYPFGDSRGAVGRANAAEPEVRGHDGLRDQAADRLCAGPWVLRWLIKLASSRPPRSCLQVLLASLAGWVNRQQQHVIE
jgi:hypothetical protein